MEIDAERTARLVSKIKKGGTMKEMTESEKSAEFNALICEAQALLIESDAMKVTNTERKALNESPAYCENDFMRLAEEMREIADKFRKLGGVK